jgi:hypothetical protein
VVTQAAIPWLGGARRLTMYLATLDCATSNPSLSSSPWMRGAPQSGFSMLIRRIGARSSVGPRSPSQWTRLPTPVATKAGPVPAHERLGLDDRQDLQDRRTQRYSWIKNQRSWFVSRTRPGSLRLTIIKWRRWRNGRPAFNTSAPVDGPRTFKYCLLCKHGVVRRQHRKQDRRNDCCFDMQLAPHDAVWSSARTWDDLVRY